MKTKMKVLLTICTLLVTFITGNIVGASGVVQEIKASLVSDFKFNVDGKEVTPRDANGKDVLPIVFEGKTYLPVRAFGNMFNYRVDWIGETKTVILMNPNYVPATEDSAIPEVELNDSQTSANLMPLNSKMKGEVWAKNILTGDFDRQDYFKIVLPKDGNLKIVLKVEKAGLQPFLKIFEDGKTNPIKSSSSGDSETREITLDLKAGTYFVYVGSNTDKTTYTLENSFN